MKNQYKKYFDDHIKEISFGLLKEFLYKELFKECEIQIDSDIKKLQDTIKELRKLKNILEHEK